MVLTLNSLSGVFNMDISETEQNTKGRETFSHIDNKM